MRKKGIAVERKTLGPASGFAAKGFLGQTLFVLPERDLVIVRQRKVPSGRIRRNEDNLADLETLASRLAR